ncbi:MAG TPA: menaquinone biosynthesis protein [Vicinamibacterales bacterium]|nr:menaquinone biosynthesis protein [Vicinamibacterales bacterium]
MNSKSIRLGAVGYLNARPLTWALDRSPDRWQVRYDLPSACATLLHRGETDLGLIPSIEYLQSPDYRFVPGVGIGSRGQIASVALYTSVPVDRIHRIALDTSSRTSVALIKVLCHHHFRIAPEFVPHGPDLAAMTRECDAGLLIGDPAFDADHEALGLTKVDLGEQWTALTGLPFIYAAWTGRPGAVTDRDVRALQDAQAEGVASRRAIADEYGRGDEARAGRAELYLRDNVRYGLGQDEAAGLQRFLDYAADLGLAPRRRTLEFF